MSRYAIVLLTCLWGLAAVSGEVRAEEECDRWVYGESSRVIVNQTCIFDNGLPPMWIQREEGGTDYEIVVPIPASVSWENVWKATLDWLALEVEGVDDKISSASAVAPTATQVADGTLSQIEYINYEIAGWLIEDGIAEDIALAAEGDPQTEGACSAIPICSKCKTYICGEFAGWYYCNCKGPGQTCCVIEPAPA